MALLDLVPPLAVAALLVGALLRRPPLPVSERLGAVARSTRRWRTAGVLLGVVAAAASLKASVLGRGALLAGPLLALCVLLGVVAGELGVRAPGGAVRSATVEVRRVRDYLPRALTTAVVASGLLLLALLVFTTAVASPDDLGRAGRRLVRTCSAVSSEGRGPWPGSFYTAPLAVVLLVGLLAAAAALRSLVRRPRQGEHPGTDDALRRQVATATVAAAGLLVTVPLVGVGLVAAPALLQVCAAPAAWRAVGTALLGVVPAALGVGLWCAATLLVPQRVRDAAAVGR